jgi:hypothetical protein
VAASEDKTETPSTPTPTSTPMDVDEIAPKAVQGGSMFDPDEIKPEITKLKPRKDDPYPVHSEAVQRKGMLLVGGKETLEGECDLRNQLVRMGSNASHWISCYRQARPVRTRHHQGSDLLLVPISD